MKSVCVFAGSSPGRNPAHRAAADALGRCIAKRGMTLVYGAGNVGLMGVIADASLAEGGDVIGVIPQFLVDMEVAHSGLTDLQVVTSMHERKLRMAELSDGIIALPGGLGTLEEMFEMLTWLQLGVHAKPCGLLNSAGFYDPLLRFLDTVQADRFINHDHRNMLLCDDQADRLLDALTAFVAPSIDKWIDRVKV